MAMEASQLLENSPKIVNNTGEKRANPLAGIKNRLISKINSYRTPREQLHALASSTDVDHSEHTHSNTVRNVGIATGVASAVLPFALDRAGIHAPVAELGLSMAAMMFAGDMYKPAHRIEEKVSRTKMNDEISSIYDSKAGNAVIVNMLARDKHIPAENIFNPEPNTPVPERAYLVLRALVEKKIEDGIPAAVARQDAMKQYAELQAKAQVKRDALGTKVKDIGLRAGDMAGGAAAGAIITLFGETVLHGSGIRGIFNLADDVGTIGFMLAQEKNKAPAPDKKAA